jgi:uncharacterized membrane protein YhhN
MTSLTFPVLLGVFVTLKSAQKGYRAACLIGTAFALVPSLLLALHYGFDVVFPEGTSGLLVMLALSFVGSALTQVSWYFFRPSDTQASKNETAKKVVIE